MPHRQATGHLALAHDRARRDLSYALHENAAQQIAALQLKLDLLMQSPGQLPPAAIQVLTDCALLAAECAKEIRRVSYALHPPLLDEFGLVAALRSRDDVQKIAADLPDSLPRLRPDTEIAVYRLIEEALPKISTLSLAHTRNRVIIELDLPSPSDTMRERVRGFQGRIVTNSRLMRITVPMRVTTAKS